MTLAELIVWTAIIIAVRLVLLDCIMKPLKDEKSREQAGNNMLIVFVGWLVVFIPMPRVNLWLMGISLAIIWSLVLWSKAMVPLIVKMFPSIRE